MLPPIAIQVFPLVMARPQILRRLKLRSSSWTWPEALIWAAVPMSFRPVVSLDKDSKVFSCSRLAVSMFDVEQSNAGMRTEE